MKDADNINNKGRILQSARLMSGCTQQQIANKLKIDITTWQDYESGKKVIPFMRGARACIYCHSVSMALLIVPTIILPKRLKNQARYVKKGFIGAIGGK